MPRKPENKITALVEMLPFDNEISATIPNMTRSFVLDEKKFTRRQYAQLSDQGCERIAEEFLKEKFEDVDIANPSNSTVAGYHRNEINVHWIMTRIFKIQSDNQKDFVNRRKKTRMRDESEDEEEEQSEALEEEGTEEDTSDKDLHFRELSFEERVMLRNATMQSPWQTRSASRRSQGLQHSGDGDPDDNFNENQNRDHTCKAEAYSRPSPVAANCQSVPSSRIETANPRLPSSPRSGALPKDNARPDLGAFATASNEHGNLLKMFNGTPHSGRTADAAEDIIVVDRPSPTADGNPRHSKRRMEEKQVIPEKRARGTENQATNDVASSKISSDDFEAIFREFMAQQASKKTERQTPAHANALTPTRIERLGHAAEAATQCSMEPKSSTIDASLQTDSVAQGETGATCPCHELDRSAPPASKDFMGRAQLLDALPEAWRSHEKLLELWSVINVVSTEAYEKKFKARGPEKEGLRLWAEKVEMLRGFLGVCFEFLEV